MAVVRMPIVCDRARSQVSRQLDGELSQLEARMLAAHLERCTDCRAFADDVAAFTDELRGAPLEHLAHPLEIRGRRRVSVPRVRVGIAAAVAVAVVGSLMEVATHTQPEKVSSPTAFGTSRPVVGHVRRIMPDGQVLEPAGQGGSTMRI